ncbi:MAG: YARHG domain-containing protein [Eubacterium sp.]|nr:YARHG domain-containing protein [Eubacterium sp.]
MFCQNCGSQLPEGAKVCPACGNPIQYYQSESAQIEEEQRMEAQAEYMEDVDSEEYDESDEYDESESSQKRPKTDIFNMKKKTMLVAIVSALIIFISLGILIFVQVFWVPTINLDQYVSIKSEGYNSVGSAKIVFDEKQFFADNDSKIRYKAGGPADADSYFNAAECLSREFLTGQLDKSTNLSNGDSIKYNWCVDENAVSQYFKVKLEMSEIPFKVEGLGEAETFDLFKDIEVEFEGSESEGTVKIYNNSDIDPVKDWTFEADKSEGLSNGDKVTISIKDADEKIEECLSVYGKVPDAEAMEIEVSGLSSSANGMEQISKKTLDKLKREVEGDLKKEAESDWYKEINLEDMTYAGAFLLKAKDAEGSADDNILKLVYVVDTSLNLEEDDSKKTGTYGFYYVAVFDDLEEKDDGTFDVNINSMKIPNNSAVFSVDSVDYYFDGYADYKDLYENEVKALEGDYQCISTVKESIKPASENVEKSESKSEDKEDDKEKDKESSKDKDNKDKKKAKDKDKDKEKKSSADVNQIISDSSTQALSEDDVKNMSDSDIQSIINSIYARNGYKFQDQSVYDQFSQYSWYKPTTSSQDEASKNFSDVERETINLLQKYR